jgi:hypothetical protein
MVMNLAQEMLAGRSLEAFLNERRAQEIRNKKQNTQGKGANRVHSATDL